MADFVLDFKQIEDQDTALTIVQVFVASVMNDKVFNVAFANNFFNQCLNNLENPTTTPKTKFYTVYMFKELSERDITPKLFGPFSRHPLYAYMEELGLRTDPKKPVQDKGKNYFPTDKTTGNNYIRLIVESLVQWSNRFGKSKDKPNRYTQTLEKLNQLQIVLPKTYDYYQPKGEKGEKGEKGQTPGGPKNGDTKRQYQSDNPQKGSPPPRGKQQKQIYVSELKFMFNQIQILQGNLQDAEEPDQIQKEVFSYHQKFTKDYEKLQTHQEEMLDGQSSDITNLFFKLTDFFAEEKELYNQHAQNNDFATYISGYAIAFEKTFEMSTLKKEKPQEISIQGKLSVQQKKSPKPKVGMPPSRPSTDELKINKGSSEVEKNKQNIKNTESRYVERETRVASKVIEACFSKLQQFSKSPQNGFSVITSSLSKEKKSSVVSRKKYPSAISNFNKSKFGASSVAKSRVQLKGIFASPPNVSIEPRNYEGELVLANLQLENVTENILRLQGHRRFKASHFKPKYILYEDDFIQIGYKSSQIYQKVQKFQAMLMFELYFGNKTQKSFRRVSLSFRGDKQSLIYTNPQVLQQNIPPMSQVKLELLNIPKSIPFSLITLQLSFQAQGETNFLSCYMPNSILQMVTYFNISPQNFSKTWGDCSKIIKTEPFRLCRHFPPDELKTLISNLNEHTRYQQFAREGSKTDYQLYTEVIIQQSYQGVIKINIRPNLNVVLQAGFYANEQDCIKYFRFYLQTLEMVLKEQVA